MPSRWKRHPEYQPLHCSHEHHLWHQGLALAIYSKAQTVTNGGKNVFFCNQTTLAKFFKAHTNSVFNAMNFLRKNGWLVPAEKQDEYLCVGHAEWVTKRVKEGKPSLCIEKKIVPPIWQNPEEAA